MITNSFNRWSLLLGLARLIIYANLHGIYFNIYCFYRSKEDQLKRFNEGASQTKEGDHPKWRAFDIYLVKWDGKADWENINAYKKLGKYWKRLSKYHYWGGDWTTLKDYNHFGIKRLDDVDINRLQKVLVPIEQPQSN